MENQEKLNLITRNLQEILGLDELKEILNYRNLNIYWGTAPTGKIHIGYLVPLLKIADLCKANCNVKILLADEHSLLDSLKTTPELKELRCIYYEKMIRMILCKLNVQVETIRFIYGSDFQLTEKYTKDMLHLSTKVPLHDAKKAGAEVVKQSNNPPLSSLLYPLYQALDEEYLEVDAEVSGVDQRKILVFSREKLPLLNYKKRIHLMNPMLTAIDAKPKTTNTNISDTKMSSSNLNSKIDFLDGSDEIKRKINKSYCADGDISFCPLMEIAKLIVFPLLENQKINKLTINSPKKVFEYNNYNELEKDFVEKNLLPQDLKFGINEFLNKFLEPIRKEFESNEMQELINKAYKQNL